jgi:FKBP-type peptidyl-prolyl cis-trans isomerase FkpA
MNKLFYILCILSIGLSACKKDYDKIDAEKIADYVASKSLTTKTTPLGVQYVIEKEGTGEYLKPEDEIAVKYSGFFLDDKIFDKSDSSIFYIEDVIRGWQEGLQGFKVGSKGKVFIPSELAYGKPGVTNGNGIKVIPAHAVLGFDIEILKKGPIKEKNRLAIKEYIKTKGWKADSLASGLFYVIDEPGTGSNPSANSSVTVKYKGYLLNGKVFDQSDNVTFSLNNVIEGWKQGIPLFKKGGKGKLLIPSRLAYYGSGSGADIAPFVPLVFDVELTNF